MTLAVAPKLRKEAIVSAVRDGNRTFHTLWGVVRTNYSSGKFCFYNDISDLINKGVLTKEGNNSRALFGLPPGLNGHSSLPGSPPPAPTTSTPVESPAPELPNPTWTLRDVLYWLSSLYDIDQWTLAQRLTPEMIENATLAVKAALTSCSGCCAALTEKH